MKTIDRTALIQALTLRDLTNPAEGPHAMQLIAEQIATALERAWRCEVRVVRASPITTARDNYDELGYPTDAVARDARYTRYVGDGVLLRTQTSALVPGALRALAGERAAPRDVLLVCPGVVYRRDQIDRLHTGEPHQLDLWRVRNGEPLGVAELRAMISTVIEAALGAQPSRTVPAVHPYTSEGRQIDVGVGEGPTWVEIGECGLAAEAVLTRAGLRGWTGLAMGLGLDRLLMIAKGIDDIRTLRSTDPRAVRQLLDLSPYRPYSAMPAVRRDLSLAMTGPADAESIGDRVRAALGHDAELIEEVTILDVTPGHALSPQAASRLGLSPGQINVTVRLVLRAHDRTLTGDEASQIRDRVYAALHEGTAWTWARGTARRG